MVNDTCDKSTSLKKSKSSSDIDKSDNNSDNNKSDKGILSSNQKKEGSDINIFQKEENSDNKKGEQRFLKGFEINNSAINSIKKNESYNKRDFMKSNSDTLDRLDSCSMRAKIINYKGQAFMESADSSKNPNKFKKRLFDLQLEGTATHLELNEISEIFKNGKKANIEKLNIANKQINDLENSEDPDPVSLREVKSKKKRYEKKISYADDYLNDIDNKKKALDKDLNRIQKIESSIIPENESTNSAADLEKSSTDLLNEKPPDKRFTSELDSSRPEKTLDVNPLINNIFIALNPKSHKTTNEKDTQDTKIDDHRGKKGTKKDNIEQSFKDAMKTFQKSFEKTLKGISDGQKKTLKKMGEKFENMLKSALQKSEEDFYKQLILILLTQQNCSKDLQGLGQANVTPINQETYL